MSLARRMAAIVTLVLVLVAVAAAVGLALPTWANDVVALGILIFTLGSIAVWVYCETSNSLDEGVARLRNGSDVRE